jgi:tRNA modification GTPase
MKLKSTTIAAAATFPAVSALAVIRLTGPETFSIMDRVFSFHNRSRTAMSAPAAALSLGLIHDGDTSIDEVFAAFFHSPSSYTGEDMAEITCHGSPFITRRILGLLVSNGAVPAGPGDFTRRAFINGKMDLPQAEAVSALTCARSDETLKLALNQLFGSEKEPLEKIRLNLINAVALVEAQLDFEHGDSLEKEEIIKWINYTSADIGRLLRGARKASVIKNGVKITIAGSPNTGKSSLLNALLGRDRAIVADLPGTTRDTIEEEIIIDSIPFLLSDTAGLRLSNDPAENEGIKRSKASISSADAVIFTVDSSTPLSAEDAAAYAEISGRPHVVAMNKSDLKAAFSAEGAKKYLRITSPVITVSAKNGSNINLLTKSLKDIIISSGGIDSSSDPVVSEARHTAALEKALMELKRASDIVEKGGALETAAEHLKYASNGIAEITGEIASSDVLDAVFKNFCVGK